MKRALSPAFKELCPVCQSDAMYPPFSWLLAKPPQEDALRSIDNDTLVAGMSPSF
jgi:hypothetical protein